MAQRDMLKRYLDAGMAFTAMTKSKAEGIVREMVKAGEVERDQVHARVEELIERSRRNTDHLIALVRKEVTSQLSELGLATRRDLEKLERRFRGMTEKDAPEAAPTEGTTAKDTATKVAGAKRGGAPATATGIATETRTGTGTGSKAAPVKKAAPAKKAAPVRNAAAATRAPAEKARPTPTPAPQTAATEAPAKKAAKRGPAKKAAPKKAPDALRAAKIAAAAAEAATGQPVGTPPSSDGDSPAS